MTTPDENSQNSQAASAPQVKAAFFDVDGTLTSEHTWKGILEYFHQKGLRRKTHLAYLGIHYPMYYLRRAGLISESAFRAPWAAHLAWYIRGYTESQAQQVWDWATTEFLSEVWRQDILHILKEHLAAGDLVMLVSSGPTPLMERIAKELGVQYAIGTRYILRDGRYTGGYQKPVCIDQFKASLPLQYLQALGVKIDLAGSAAYADSIADLSLLEMVGNPVSVYPDDQLAAIARQRGWKTIPD